MTDEGRYKEYRFPEDKQALLRWKIESVTDLLKIKMVQVREVKCLRSVPYKEQEEERLLLAK